MQNQNSPWKRIRLVFRRGSKLAKVVILLAIVLSAAALLTLKGTIEKTQAQAEALKSQAAGLEQEQNRLEQNIEGLGTLDGVEQIAKDELGLVDPDTVIIEPEQ